MTSAKRAAFIALLLVAGAAWLLERHGAGRSGTSSQADHDGAAALQHAFDHRLNDEWIEARVRVVQLLGDDQDGSRHQRFIAETSRRQTLLIAHNIDVAPRVPVALGDSLRFRGVYEWNERGGVIHWTHHDPMGRLDGGYIEHGGRIYK